MEKVKTTSLDEQLRSQILSEREVSNVKTKTLSEILDLEGEPNILEEMVDNNFKDYKISMLKEGADSFAIVIEGFDDALIGMSHDGRLVYDIGVMRKILVERDKMKSDEADEFLDYNVFGVNFGELDPIFVTLNMDLVFQTLK
jgi:hypothetical protein